MPDTLAWEPHPVSIVSACPTKCNNKSSPQTITPFASSCKRIQLPMCVSDFKRVVRQRSSQREVPSRL